MASHPPIGYCTNVHSGNCVDEVVDKLKQYSLAVKTELDFDVLNIGLWLNERSVAELESPQALAAFRSFLIDNGLNPYTFNAFPQKDFHQDIVKHSVYEPDWSTDERLDYTVRLARLIPDLLSDRRHATISTLPLGWRHDQAQDFEFACRKQMTRFIEAAEQIETDKQFHLRLCIEPEPGCHLGNHTLLHRFFEKWLAQLSEVEASRLQRYLGVCHDVCHSAVLFEDQASVLRRYADIGIEIAKVQVSSAVKARFQNALDSQNLKKQLADFAEPKYLHQTCVDGQRFYQDLNEALDHESANGEWRVHFHVPIHAKSLLGGLETTQQQILEAIQFLQHRKDKIDWEVETYAWSVLPENQKPLSLTHSTLNEIKWLQATFDSIVKM
ncbi:MAG: metabolite traffic protein EboE [Pirellulaceae bacterium]